MEPLTKRQQQVLEFIKGNLGAGSPPSQREIARHFGISQNAACQLVGYLRKKGYLTKTSCHRGLRLAGKYIDKLKNAAGIPIVGRVAAGEPILAEENIEGYINLQEMFRHSEKTFILKVVGDSMADEGITDGDFVVVEPASVIENGGIAVVMLDGEATVKKMYIRQGKIVLKPANKAGRYRTRYIKKGSSTASIIGKVTGCFKLVK